MTPSAGTRPPLASVPLFLRCTACAEPFRATGSFLGPVVVGCPCCGRRMRLVPRSAAKAPRAASH